MSAINTQFLPTFSRIAADPKTQLSKFAIITPTHEKVYSTDNTKVAFGVASGIFSLIIFKKTKPGFLSFLSFAAFSLYYSFESKNVPTEAFKAQVQEIDALFKPSIQGLNECHNAKALAIYDAVHGKELLSIDDIEPLIELVIATYDRKSTTAVWDGKPIKENSLDDKTYTELTTSADLIVKAKADEVSTNPTVLERFKELQHAADRFLNGKKKTDERRNVLYVNYSFAGQTAKIFTI